MEKYGQYRDKGSGVAPFFPISPPPSNPLLLPWSLFLCCIRIPLLAFAWILWLTLIQWLPAGGALRKANQWCLLGIPGVWWIDLQVDGVRRGSLSQTPRAKLPYPGAIIASSWTSPLDILYLAAIFDPIFTQSSPSTNLIKPITQESALASCFGLTNPLAFTRPEPRRYTSLAALTLQNPTRIIVVFPEATTSNGRAILNLTPSLTSASPKTNIYPVSLRYVPADVVTPIPGWLEALRFIWRLNSAQTHCIRVRIGAAMTMAPLPTYGGVDPSASAATKTSARRTAADRGRNTFESNFFDTLQSSPAPKVAGGNGESEEGEDADDDADEDEAETKDVATEQERRKLDAVADDLARLGRVKRVDLGVMEKARFVEAWARGRKSRK